MKDLLILAIMATTPTDTIPAGVGEIVYMEQGDPMPYDSGFALSYRQYEVFYLQGMLGNAISKSDPKPAPVVNVVIEQPKKRKRLGWLWGVLGVGAGFGLSKVL